MINVRSTRGRNSKGSKITGIEVLNNDENKILITSNDSRIRLYDLRDLSLVCKYRGFSNSTVHIKASLRYKMFKIVQKELKFLDINIFLNIT